MNRLKTIFCLTFLLCLSALAQKPIQLGGSWEYAIGESPKYNDYVMLPGEVKSDGKVWYRHGVYVPQDWYRQRITLYLERLYADATIFVNDQKVGHDSLRCAPHEYDVTELIIPGQRNTVVVCVAKSERNGIFGKMELRAGSRQLYLRELHIQPYPFDGRVHLDVTMGGDGLRFDDYIVEVMAQRTDVDSAGIIRRYYNMTKRHSTFDMFLGNEVALWDEFHPHLYRLVIDFGDGFLETAIGMRELKTDSSQVMINQRPLYLRSVVMGNPGLETGSTLSDEQAWFDLLQKYKHWGFNHIRFEDYCPTEAAFAMADKLGLLLQPGGIKGEKQTKRVFNAYGHHPSLMMTEVEGIERIPAQKDFSIGYYKERIERNLKTADSRGFQLEDFAWPEKNEPAKEWTEFCAPIVPLAKFQKYEYSMTDSLEVPLEACSAFYGEIQAARVAYFICDDSMKVVQGGQLAVAQLPIGKNIPLGIVMIPLSELPAPGKYSLYVAIAGRFRNHWEFELTENRPR